MYRSFADFQKLNTALATDFLVGYRQGQTEFKIDFYTLSRVISGGLTRTPNVLYVSVSGSDTSTGVGEAVPVRSIKKACQIAANDPGNNYTIFVRSGNYYEDNPVYVPPRTSIIGDNLRRVSVYPLNVTRDILWVSNADYVWGVTFRGHRSPGAAVAFWNLDRSTVEADDDYVIAFERLPLLFKPTTPQFITTSPYIQGCSSITNSSSPGADDAGAGMRIDGKLVRGFIRSMVLDSYTLFNEGGLGVHIINNGYAQLVSIFTICCTAAVMCSAGGSCDINTSNASFGLTGIAAVGKSNTPILTGTVVRDEDGNNNIIAVSGVEWPFDLDIARTPNLGQLMEIDQDWRGTRFSITSATSAGPFQYEIIFDGTLGIPVTGGNTVKFYLRSSILAAAYTMEYIGSGTTLNTALPAFGGQVNEELQVIQQDGGVCYFTFTNESGDFKIGPDFTVNQATGTITGRAFDRSLFALVTPFVLALEGSSS
jgi:hypothetical protein